MLRLPWLKKEEKDPRCPPGRCLLNLAPEISPLLGVTALTGGGDGDAGLSFFRLLSFKSKIMSDSALGELCTI